jgi:acetyltransferase-like isoleucine patch superfamily enzyme
MDGLYRRWDRRLQLLRGWLVKVRGAKAGERFGLGSGVQIQHPEFLTAGHDVTILDNAFLDCLSDGGVRIGDHTAFHTGFRLHCSHNRDQLGFFRIGTRCLVEAYVVMDASGGGITIGDHALIGQMVTIHAGSHRFDDPDRLIIEHGTTHEGVVIEDDCWIGAKASILDGVTIGRGSVIGAGAVVTRTIPPYSVAVGNPARVIRRRE